MRKIADFPLWIGHVGDLRDLRLLHATGLAAAVDVAGNEPPTLLTRDLVSCRFPLVDGAGNPPWLLRAAVEIVAGFMRARVPTLVSCSAGQSRSVCVAAAALAWTTHRTLRESLAFLAQFGPADVTPGLYAEIEHVLVNPASDFFDQHNCS